MQPRPDSHSFQAPTPPPGQAQTGSHVSKVPVRSGAELGGKSGGWAPLLHVEQEANET